MFLRKLFLIFAIGFLLFIFFIYNEIFRVEVKHEPQIRFTVQRGESAGDLAERLATEKIIGNAYFFKKYISWKNIDTKIQAGDYTVNAPITIARVARVLSQPAGKEEKTVTIIPGWDLRDVAEYLEKEGFGTKEEVAKYVGESATVYTSGNVPLLGLGIPENYGWKNNNSLEGYLAPDTYRVYANATLEDVLSRLILERKKQLDNLMPDVKKSDLDIHEIITLASILEQEVKSKEDKAKVADIFLRRLKIGMALQADSTVHYTAGKTGTVFTTAADRKKKTLWNTYVFPGLPQSPICNPGLQSITAVLHPEKNDAWYFLTTTSGEVKYGRTLDEHNANRARYL